MASEGRLWMAIGRGRGRLNMLSLKAERISFPFESDSATLLSACSFSSLLLAGCGGFQCDVPMQGSFKSVSYR